MAFSYLARGGEYYVQALSDSKGLGASNEPYQVFLSRRL